MILEEGRMPETVSDQCKAPHSEGKPCRYLCLSHFAESLTCRMAILYLPLP
jgi:hypothetical protein